jgi:tRNA U34 5-methylaminomethyl-2-thiouridine-forming methyltransferase MnmC
LNQIVITADGSHTIYVPELNEHYHSVHGAIQESEHIFIKNGLDVCNADPINIFEIGFGTGLNAFLTAIRGIKGTREIFYTSIEKYPIDENIVRSLNYCNIQSYDYKDLFSLLHSSPWNFKSNICKNFNLLKIKGDLKKMHSTEKYDLIYFDAFGPDKQPSMWTEEIFRNISSMTNKGGIFVTYSAKGELKRILRSCGFEVNRVKGPPGKRQITMAVKK